MWKPLLCFKFNWRITWSFRGGEHSTPSSIQIHFKERIAVTTCRKHNFMHVKFSPDRWMTCLMVNWMKPKVSSRVCSSIKGNSSIPTAWAQGALVTAVLREIRQERVCVKLNQYALWMAKNTDSRGLACMRYPFDSVSSNRVWCICFEAIILQGLSYFTPNDHIPHYRYHKAK